MTDERVISWATLSAAGGGTDGGNWLWFWRLGWDGGSGFFSSSPLAPRGQCSSFSLLCRVSCDGEGGCVRLVCSLLSVPDVARSVGVFDVGSFYEPYCCTNEQCFLSI